MDSISIRCVAFFDPAEGNWCAVALDLDIVAEGKTQDEVVKDLNDLIEAQIGFALFKGDLSLIWRKAPPEYWEIYERLRQKHVRELAGQAIEGDEGSVSDLPFPDMAAIERNRVSFA